MNIFFTKPWGLHHGTAICHLPFAIVCVVRELLSTVILLESPKKGGVVIMKSASNIKLQLY